MGASESNALDKHLGQREHEGSFAADAFFECAGIKAHAVANLGDAALIDYDNFKDMIKATPHQKAKLEPYEEVWTLLYNAHFSHRPQRQ